MMAKGKAESLDEVFELARTRRQSGMLTVEHTQGGRIEEGEVYIQAGQPIYARVGHLVGQDALNWLLKWRNINFSLGAEDLRHPLGTPGTPAANDTNTATVPEPQPASSSSLSAENFTGLASDRAPAEANSSSHGNSYTPGVEWLVPQKRNVDRDVLSLPLTRRQRFIYFLVDGRRTLSDLSRCTGKNIQEIELILDELQVQGLVAV